MKTIAAIGLAAALGALAAIGLPGGRAGAQTADQLQAELASAVDNDPTHLPGAILYASRPGKGTFLVAAGIADITTGAALTTDAHFRAGSILKTLIAVVVLELAEEGKLRLDDPIAGLVPTDVASRFPRSGEITVRMLLNHTSGVPEWLNDAMVGEIAANPARVWTVNELLDRAAAQPAAFAPGSGWAYSNTDYNLAGLVIEKVTGRPWREAVAERIISRLKLTGTSLPAPGTVAIPEPTMHGYGLVNGAPADLSYVDPSMADAAGGGALVTTVADLATVLAAIREGTLFADKATFATMASFVAAQGPGGEVGYGLGLEKYLFPGGLEIIGHLGGTAGYRSGTFFVPKLDLSLAFAMSVEGDPTAVMLAALKILAPEALH